MCGDIPCHWFVLSIVREGSQFFYFEVLILAGIATGFGLLGGIAGWLVGMRLRQLIHLHQTGQALEQGQAIEDHSENPAQRSAPMINLSLESNDRAKIEIALRQSENKYRALIEALPDLIMRMTGEGAYLDFYPTQTFKVLGGTDLVGRGIYEGGLPPELAALRLQYIRQALQTGKLQSYEQQILVDGEIRSEDVRITVCGENEVVVIVRDMTDRKHAEEALQQKIAQEQLLGEITDRIRQSLDLHRILTTAVAEVKRLLHADRVVIYRFQSDWSSEILTESVATGFQSILDRIYRDPDFAKTPDTAIDLRWVQSIADIHTAQLSPAHLTALTQLQIRAMLVLPILLHHTPLHKHDWEEDRVWGLLGVHSCVKPRQWQPEDIEFLRKLTGKLAIAIQQSALYQQLQQSNITLEYQVQKRTAALTQALNFEATLKRITDAVRDSLDETRILQTAVNELSTTLGLDSCETALYDRERMTLTIQCDFSQSRVSVQGSLVSMSAYPALYAQMLNGLGCQFCPITDAIALRPAARQSTILSCPLSDDQNVIGDMWLFKPCTEVFDELEVRLVQQVANQCAIALRQSHLYQAAQAQVNELERLNRLKDDFLSTVSHELRTPMSNIKMATQMLEILLEQSGLLGAEANLTRYVQILKEEGQREMGLINDLLELSRLEAEAEPLFLTSIALQDWIPHIVELFVDRIERQQQQLQLDLPPDLPPLTTDLAYLERIVTELLNNACKYTPTGEMIRVTVREVHPPQPRLRMEDEVERDEPFPLSFQLYPLFLQICVTNTGIEIPESEHDRIFEKFYRIPNSDPWKHDGTGLGLALVKKLVQNLGGTITVSSQPIQTTFTVQFPVRDKPKRSGGSG
jgi:PAS domain S-box-containing protein